MISSYEVARGNLPALLLQALEKEPRNPHHLIKTFREQLGITFSSGSIYSILYGMERKGLVKGVERIGAIKFKITQKGIQKLKENKAALIQTLKFLEIGI